MTLYQAFTARRGSEKILLDAGALLVGSILMTLAAKATVPFYPVPLSMQTFVAIGLGLALGPLRGGLAIMLYLAEGAMGMPVFAGTPEKGIGLAYMVGPTGGFLVGFLLQAVIAGLFARHGRDRSPLTTAAIALIAAAAIYPTGLFWLGAVIGFDKPLLALGLYPFILGDVVKALLAAAVFPLVWRLIERPTV
ncbi:MAG: biotin transporter BioY [Nitratireductor sp.]|nr:biotin transporter BioY [Nitratireductor sp.]